MVSHNKFVSGYVLRSSVLLCFVVLASATTRALMTSFAAISAPAASERIAPAEKLFANSGCENCHCGLGQGTDRGPSLVKNPRQEYLNTGLRVHCAQFASGQAAGGSLDTGELSLGSTRGPSSLCLPAAQSSSRSQIRGKKA
jgi:hypothetical protein